MGKRDGGEGVDRAKSRRDREVTEATEAVRGKSVIGEEIWFVFNDTATTGIYTLSLHDALPISITPVLIFAFVAFLDLPVALTLLIAALIALAAPEIGRAHV